MEELMQIVKVKYWNEELNAFNSREYSYLSADILEVGDLVVPVRDTIGKAMVTAVNLPESSVAAFKDKLKVIPSGSWVKEKTLPVDMPDDLLEALNGNFAEATVCELNETSMPPHVNTPAPKPETMPSIVTDDQSFIALKDQITGIVKYAKAREVTNPDQLNGANNDLIIMRKLEKSVDQLRRQWVDPLNAQVKTINDTFKELSTPLTEADTLTVGLITKYNNDVDAARKQAEDLNRQAEELARKQAAANNGVFTVDTTPVFVPAPVAKTNRVESGTVGTRKTRKARVIDFSKLPDTYKLANERLLNTAASTGVKEIPGVEFYWDSSLTTRGSK
jgi:hypothetical protein